MRGVSAAKPVLNEGKKSSKPDFLDMDKDSDTKEPMKKAVKDKSKGAIAEAVARVEQQLAEKYMGFKKTAAAVAKGGSADNPEAVAAAIGRKKYGKEKFQKAAAAGKKLGEGSEDHGDEDDIAAKRRRDREPDPDWDRVKKAKASKKMHEGNEAPNEYEQNPYGQSQKKLKPGNTIGSKIATGAKNMKRKAEKFVANTMGNNLERGPLGEHNYTEDMLSPAQKKFAALAEPKDKITYADKIAGAKKKTEGNKFSGNLMKARAQGLEQADLDGDGEMEPVKEGWDDMLKAAKERSGPQPSGGAGIKSGKRYGGAAQKDEPETDNETGEVAKKGRGRPKKDKFAK